MAFGMFGTGWYPLTCLCFQNIAPEYLGNPGLHYMNMDRKKI